jgi:hypothetical protein
VIELKVIELALGDTVLAKLDMFDAVGELRRRTHGFGPPFHADGCFDVLLMDLGVNCARRNRTTRELFRRIAEQWYA